MTGTEAIKQCRFWSLGENWGRPEMVDPALVFLTHDYRIFLGHPLIISPVKGAVYAIGGHSDKSWHKIIDGRNSLSMAMDVFPDCNLALAWLTALRFPFGGVGVYPFARNGPMQGMLHLDVRPTTIKVLWWRDSNFKYHYLKMKEDVWDLLSILSRYGL